MQPMTLKKRRFYFYILIVVFFIIIPIIMLYTSGYRISKDFKLVKTGGIYIYSPETGSTIYINNKKKRQTNIFQKDLFVQNLKPNDYNILVAKDGFWPWAKEVTVKEKRVSEAIAFLIPREPKGKLIPKIITEEKIINNATTTLSSPNTEYTEIIVLFDAEDNNVATSSSKINADKKSKVEKISKRGRVGIWSENNKIFAVWLKSFSSLPNYFCRLDECKESVLVFESNSKIKNLDFYPGREDVLLLSIKEGVYAIEIDARKNQNFQPVYKGYDPYFVIKNGQFYIKDSENLFKIDL